MATKTTEKQETKVEETPVAEKKPAITIDDKPFNKTIVEKVKKSGKETIYLPLKENEEEGSSETVQISGVIYQVMKGVEIEVPKAVALVLRKSMPKPKKK